MAKSLILTALSKGFITEEQREKAETYKQDAGVSDDVALRDTRILTEEKMLELYKVIYGYRINLDPEIEDTEFQKQFKRHHLMSYGFIPIMKDKKIEILTAKPAELLYAEDIIRDRTGYKGSFDYCLITISSLISLVEMIFKEDTSLADEFVFEEGDSEDNIYDVSEGDSSQIVALVNKLLRDAMTGLYNHASFYGFLDTITKANSEDISTITLAIIDIDNFKKVNDTYGHSKGDEVILFLAEVLKRRFTDVGYVCRYGGEEFAVIFINKNGRQAKELMEGALEEFRRHEFSWKEDPVTFSCGICEYMSGRMTDKELFGIADKVLYRAKNSGKNQCLL